MNITDHRVTISRLHQLAAPHRYGHRCHDDQWYDPHLNRDRKCPPLATALTAAAEVEQLADQVHAAAHDPEARRVIAEGMTGLVLADLPAEERDGWSLTAAMAAEALAEHLDPALRTNAARMQVAAERLRR